MVERLARPERIYQEYRAAHRGRYGVFPPCVLDEPWTDAEITEDAAYRVAKLTPGLSGDPPRILAQRGFAPGEIRPIYHGLVGTGGLRDDGQQVIVVVECFCETMPLGLPGGYAEYALLGYDRRYPGRHIILTPGRPWVQDLVGSQAAIRIADELRPDPTIVAWMQERVVPLGKPYTEMTPLQLTYAYRVAEQLARPGVATVEDVLRIQAEVATGRFNAEQTWRPTAWPCPACGAPLEERFPRMRSLPYGTPSDTYRCPQCRFSVSMSPGPPGSDVAASLRAFYERMQASRPPPPPPPPLRETPWTDEEIRGDAQAALATIQPLPGADPPRILLFRHFAAGELARWGLSEFHLGLPDEDSVVIVAECHCAASAVPLKRPAELAHYEEPDFNVRYVVLRYVRRYADRGWGVAVGGPGIEALLDERPLLAPPGWRPPGGSPTA